MTEKELAKAIGKSPLYLRNIRKGIALTRNLPVLVEGEDWYRTCKTGPNSFATYTPKGVERLCERFGVELKPQMVVEEPAVIEPAAVETPVVETPEQIIMRKMEERREQVRLKMEAMKVAPIPEPSPNVAVSLPKVVMVVDQAKIDAGEWVPTRITKIDCLNQRVLQCQINGQTITVRTRPEWKKDMYTGMLLNAMFRNGYWQTCEPLKGGVSGPKA